MEGNNEKTIKACLEIDKAINDLYRKYDLTSLELVGILELEKAYIALTDFEIAKTISKKLRQEGEF